jgi:hypothetical protein
MHIFIQDIFTVIYVYIYIYIDTYLYIYIYQYMYVYQYLSIYLSTYLSIDLSIYPSIYLSIYLCAYLPTYLPTYLSILPSIHLSLCGARGSPGLVDRLRALILCARQSRSLAAQLVALDSGCCAVSAGCTVPTSALGPARHGLSVSMQSAHAKAERRRANAIAHRWGSRTTAGRPRAALRPWPPRRRLCRGELGRSPTRFHNS